MQPVLRRTWGPRGCRPVLQQSQRHDRLSLASALAVSPRRRRVSLYWHSQRRNIRACDLVAFLRQLRRHIRRNLVLVLDRWSVHRARAVRHWHERCGESVVLEWLPPYAPELNPVEQVWDHSKYSDLANFCPGSADHLEFRVGISLCKQSERHSLLRSFFDAANLPL